MESGKLYINGTWREGRGERFASHNPATGEVLWQGGAASEADINEAVDAACKAFESWGALPMEERQHVLEKFRSIVEARKDALALVLAAETGKVLWDSRSEIAAMLGKLAFTIAAYHERTGKRTGEGQGFSSALQHKPHGVLAVYGPYNFPAHLPNGHIMPALLAGNTVIFKPSELTPHVAEEIMHCWQEAGIPSGVIQLIQGERETGKILSAHAGINGLLFTGSSATGNILSAQFAKTPHKILALELGGNNPLIVHDVEDAKAAAYGTIQSAYVSSGQRCTCARRLIVPRGATNDAFIDALADMIAGIKVGAYTDTPEPFMGPLIAQKEADKLIADQDTFIAKGAKVIVAMQRLHTSLPFVSPALLDVTDVKDRPDTEWFGPLLQLIRVDTLEEAIAEANNTAYGLAAGIFTDSREHYALFLKHIRAGIVNWNRPTTGASGNLPFGGIGESGNHRPAAYYAADYCAYPVASNEAEKITLPATPSPGLKL